MQITIVLPSAGTFNILEMSARKRESTEKLKVSKTEIEKLSNNERMLNKKKENSFRIILPTKMAEIFAFKI